MSNITYHNAQCIKQAHRPTGPHTMQIEQDNHQGFFEHVRIMSLATLVIILGCGHPLSSWNTWECILLLLLPRPVKEEQPRRNPISAVSLIFILINSLSVSIFFYCHLYLCVVCGHCPLSIVVFYYVD